MNEDELIKKYGLDIEVLKKEQTKLAKGINVKDAMDFSFASTFGAVESMLINNQIISVIIICDRAGEISEQQYFLDKLRFPYLNEFRSFRELPSVIGAFNKLSNKPDVVFIRGHGITHPRLGIASHFSLLTNIPAIGIAESLFDCDKVDKLNIVRDGKIVGKAFQSKQGSNPLFISSGNNISLETSYNFVKEFIKPPHKLPEPLYLAHRYARDVREELRI